MDWFKNMTKNDGFIFNLVNRFNSDGYYVYFKTISILAEGNFFYKPMRESHAYLEHLFVCVPWPKLDEIYQYSASEGKILYENTNEIASVYIPKLEELNPEYARKHRDIIEKQRKASTDGRRTEDGRKTDGVERKKEEKEEKEEKEGKMPPFSSAYADLKTKYMAIKGVDEFVIGEFEARDLKKAWEQLKNKDKLIPAWVIYLKNNEHPELSKFIKHLQKFIEAVGK